MTEHRTRSAAAVVYPVTYHRELSPAWLNHAAVLGGAAGIALDRPFRYLELGCGHGLSTLMHAAAFPQAEFHACDLDAAAIRGARQRAARLGIDNATFHEASFDDLSREPLSPFDFVVAHGVYSWVDDAARRCLRRLMAGCIAPSGIAYLSYNCMPGWAAEAPLRRLMQELARCAGDDGADRVRFATSALQGLCHGGLAYFRLHPEAAVAVAGYPNDPVGYLGHEFLGADWASLYSVDVLDEMADAGLVWLGSATLPDNHVALLVDDETARLIDNLPSHRLRLLATDFAVSRRFRRDLFAPPGVRAEPGGARSTLIVGCPGEPADIATGVRVPRGSLTFAPAFIDRLRAAIADGPAPLDELVDRLAPSAAARTEVLRNLMYLTAAGALVPCARCSTPRTHPRRYRVATATIRRMVAALAESGRPGWVASPTLGSAVMLEAIDARTLLAQENAKRPDLERLARLRRLGLVV